MEVGAVIRAVWGWMSTAPSWAVLSAYAGVFLVALVVIVGSQKLWDHLRTGGAGRARMTNDPRRSEVRNKPTRRR